MSYTQDKSRIKFSVVVPVYNRPDELRELLSSLALQSDKDFDIIIVEDGSDIKCDDVIEAFSSDLSIRYFYKANSGPGLSRNFGMAQSDADYFIIFDSDVIVPPDYISIARKFLYENYVDVYGGPDREHPSFSDFQKAINYSMTSFFTTGGIRGGSERLDKFHPRSFNMGISRHVFDHTGGFAAVPGNISGEDIDFSLTVKGLGYQTGLIKDAFVYHKRRSSIKQFGRQVYRFGYARINITRRHKNTLKLVHLAPTVFLCGLVFCFLSGIFISPMFFALPFVYAVIIYVDAAMKNSSLAVARWALLTSFIQLSSYGYGFMVGIWEIVIRGKSTFVHQQK